MRMFVNSLLVVCLLVGLVGCGGDGPPKRTTKKEDDTGEKEAGVIMLRYKPGSESTEQRERGFLNTMEKEFPEIKVISSDVHAGLTPETSKDAADQLLIKYGDRVTGMFAVCEPNAEGTLKALEEKEMTDQVVFVGFDPNQRMVEAVKEGKMAGIVLQDPVKMGYTAVMTIVQHLDDETVEKQISTGEHVVTPDNVEKEEMQALIHPPQFSGTPTEVDEPKYRIAVIPKGTRHEFWACVHEGAENAAKELGNIEVIWTGPQSEGNVQQQMEIMQSFIDKGVDGICLAPNDSQSLVESVKAANEKEIPCVIYDSGLEPGFKDFVSYVATDNYEGGALAARTLGAALKKKAEKAEKSGSE